MMSPVVHSVSQVALYLKDKLESDSLLASLTVQGEIANLRTVASGHSYFSLREDGSSIRCVMFRGRSGQEFLEEGQEVLAGGNFTFYAPYGEANMQVAAVLPVGAGALALELARLRQRLESEGLFDPSRKRPLPQFPSVIGVVTSPNGAVWQDIQNVVRRRYPLAELLLSPTAVQGDVAAGQIVQAIELINRERLADVIIVARGGGSLEDLWCFNSEDVARAIFGSRVPVVAGVGHETDHTITDDVADRRAPTPSAAAELATPDRNQLLANLFGARQQMTSVMVVQVDRQRSRVAALEQSLLRRAPDLGLMRRRIDELTERAARVFTRRRDGLQRDVATLEAKLNALNPADTLRRGYAVVRRSADGAVLTTPQQVDDGALLDITLAGGTIGAAVGEQGSNKSHAGNRASVAVNEVGAGDGGGKKSRAGDRRKPTAPRAMRPLL